MELKEGQTKTKGYAGTPGEGLTAGVRAAAMGAKGTRPGVLGSRGLGWASR